MDTNGIEQVVHHLVMEIGVTVLVGSVMAYLFHRIKLPLILSYLATGVVVGANMGFGLVESETGLHAISEIGLVLLLFMIGLEIDVSKMRAAGSSLITTGIVQFLGSASLAFGFFVMLGFGVGGGAFDAAYLAVGCAISSTAVVVKLLYGKSELDTMSGRLTVGVLVFQDLWAIVMLGIQPSLANPDLGVVLFSFVKMGMMITVGILISKFILPSVFKSIAKSPELIILASLGWCVAVCALAYELGLSIEMGALIAGVGMSTFPYTLDVEAKLSNVRDVLVILFFVSLGMMIPSPLTNPWLVGVALATSLVVIVLRLLSVYPVLRAHGNGNRVSLLTSFNLSNISEFSLVLAAIGVKSGHVTSSILTILIYAFVFSAVISSFVINNSRPLQVWITRHILNRLGLRDRSEVAHEDGETLGKDIAFLGFFHTASSMIEEFRNAEAALGEKNLLERSIVIDFNQVTHDKLREAGVTPVYGDIAHIDTLHHAGIADVKVAISTISDSVLVGTTNAKIVEGIRTVCPQALVIATARGPHDALAAYDAGADYVYIPRMVGASHLMPIVTLMLSAAANEHDALRTVQQQRENHMDVLRTRVEILA